MEKSKMTLEFRIRYERAGTGVFAYYYVTTNHSDEAVGVREELIDMGFHVGQIEWNAPFHGWMPLSLLEESDDDDDLEGEAYLAQG